MLEDIKLAFRNKKSIYTSKTRGENGKGKGSYIYNKNQKVKNIGINLIKWKQTYMIGTIPKDLNK